MTTINQLAVKAIEISNAIKADRAAGGTAALQALIASAGALKAETKAAGYTDAELAKAVAELKTA